MSTQSRQQTPTQQSSSDQAVSETSPASQGSNGQQADSIRTADGTAKGLENYQATLGQWLGGELYGAIAPHLTLEKMAGYADKALLSAFSSLAGELEKLDIESNPGDLEKLSKAFKEAFGTAAGDWLKDDGAGLASSLAGWVDAHPRLIVTAALLAAAGAYMANATIPELSTSFGLSEDLKLKLGAKLGSLRDISLRQVSAELSHATAPLVAAIKVSTGDSTKTEFSGSYGDEERKLTVSGEVTGQDLNLLEIQGLLQAGGGTIEGGYKQSGGDEKINVDFTDQNGNTKHVTGVDYDPGSGTLTLRNVLTQTTDGGSNTFSSSFSSDGSNSRSLSISENLSGDLAASLTLSQAATRLGASDSYQLSEEQKASAGLNYNTSDLKAALSLSTDNNHNHSASGSVDWSNGSGLQGGGNASKSWGSNETLQVGAYFGFRNPEEFETYMVKYTFADSGSASQNFDLMLEKKLGPVYTRIQQQFNSSIGGSDWTTTAQGAYFINDNVALIGGAQYKGSSTGDSSLAPQLGAQIYGIPLVVTHDFENDATTIGVTFKFGR